MKMANFKLLAGILVVVAAVFCIPAFRGDGAASAGREQVISKGGWSSTRLTCSRCGREAVFQVLEGRYNTKVCPHCSHLFRAYVPRRSSVE